MSNEPSAATPKRKMRRKSRFLPIVIVLAALAGGYYWYNGKNKPKEDTGPMITDVVSRGDLTESVNATGSIAAQTGAQVKIGAQVSGRIKRLYADIGSRVKAGEVIAELDLPDLRAQVQQAEANLQAERARLAQQEANLSLQRTLLDNAVIQARASESAVVARLGTTQASSRLQTAQTPTNIRRAESEVARATSALATSRTTLAQLETSAKVQLATAGEQVKQAQANANNSAANLKRQQQLLNKGFVAASLVDTAVATDAVNQSAVSTARQNVELIRQQTTAAIETARNSVAQSQQAIDSAQAALESAKAGTFSDVARQADVTEAKAQVARARADTQTAVANQQQLAQREKEVSAAREAVKASQAQVDISRARLDYSYIRSPISGTVLQLAAQQGEVLAAGLSVSTLIIVADLSKLEVTASVDETDIGKIKLGQIAEVGIDALPGKKLEGKVTKIASGSTILSGVITYAVTIAFTKVPEIPLKPDMTASVTIVTGTKKNILLVPAEAVKVGTKGSTVNMLVKKDGKDDTEPRNVKTGASDGVKTEILDGLKEGDKIVLAGNDNKKRGGGAPNPFGPSQGTRGAGGGGGGGGRGGGGGGGR